MTLAPERYLSACLEVLRRATIHARLIGYAGTWHRGAWRRAPIARLSTERASANTPESTSASGLVVRSSDVSGLAGQTIASPTPFVPAACIREESWPLRFQPIIITGSAGLSGHRTSVASPDKPLRPRRRLFQQLASVKSRGPYVSSPSSSLVQLGQAPSNLCGTRRRHGSTRRDAT